ncbi:MAG: hypothetical protein COU31_04595 [Candidatus Magasanikbacteria bacterium CG10_big_fil_rev_8_21_14_0_10_40_10]|uniref:DUF11 domain-containing protein n=1 Tax=Candidatus Magasanikbacteria bacterium CG10_big_fil_rev_8_21_14_0_10_40_10 TaxID=1974648 RepID=A0A2M6W2W0_9BACT|nr:MAG: hypothetical protein COU31_04595 [Candidatus Magasanikbacteria bacterium CG10_big_fil_rev_8_21_14_0_10_40_10]
MFRLTYRLLRRHFHVKYKSNYRHAKKLFIFDIGLVALTFCLVGLTIFFFLWKPQITDLIDLRLSMGANRVLSGQYVEVMLQYQNRSEHYLMFPTLSLELPTGFIIDRQKTPTEYFSNDFEFLGLKDIPPNESKKYSIYGWLWSTPSAENHITANLAYQPSDTKRQEQKISRLLIKLPQSILAGNLQISPMALTDQTLNFTYTLTNTAKYSVNNLKLAYSYPEALESLNKTFNLESGQAKSFVGSIKPTQAGEINFSIWPQIQINSQTIDLEKSSRPIKIYQPQIDLQATMPSQLKYIDVNATVPIQITLKNNSPFAFKNIKIKLSPNYANVINWTKTASANFALYQNNQLIIDNQSLTKLFSKSSDLTAGEDKNFTINFYINSGFSLNPNIANAYLEITPSLQAELDAPASPIFEKTGLASRLPLAGQPVFTAQARYYTANGDQVGRGVLPPTLGQSTKYWLFLQINNGSSPLSNSSLSAYLPAGVALTDRDSVTIGSNVSFDDKTRKLTWQYNGQLAPNELAGIYFEVEIKPNPQDVGKSVTLLEKIIFQTTDSWVNKKITWQKDLVNNILPNDDLASKFDYKVQSSL